jgi:hypothetical protein
MVPLGWQARPLRSSPLSFISQPQFSRLIVAPLYQQPSLARDLDGVSSLPTFTTLRISGYTGSGIGLMKMLETRQPLFVRVTCFVIFALGFGFSRSLRSEMMFAARPRHSLL